MSLGPEIGRNYAILWKMTNRKCCWIEPGSLGRTEETYSFSTISTPCRQITLKLQKLQNKYFWTKLVQLYLSLSFSLTSNQVPGYKSLNELKGTFLHVRSKTNMALKQFYQKGCDVFQRENSWLNWSKQRHHSPSSRSKRTFFCWWQDCHNPAMERLVDFTTARWRNVSDFSTVLENKWLKSI